MWHRKCSTAFAMINKTSFLLIAAANLVFVALMAKLMESLNRHAPVGYEDDSGFHFGLKA